MGPNSRYVWTLVGSFHSDKQDTPALAAFVVVAVVVAAVAVAAVAGCQQRDSWESRETERNRESLQTRCPSFCVVCWRFVLLLLCTTEDYYCDKSLDSIIVTLGIVVP